MQLWEITLVNSLGVESENFIEQYLTDYLQRRPRASLELPMVGLKENDIRLKEKRIRFFRNASKFRRPQISALIFLWIRPILLLIVNGTAGSGKTVFMPRHMIVTEWRNGMTWEWVWHHFLVYKQNLEFQITKMAQKIENLLTPEKSLEYQKQSKVTNRVLNVLPII